MSTNYVRFSSGEQALAEQKRQEKLIRERVIPAAQIDSANATLRRVVASSPVDRGEFKAGWEVQRLTTGEHPEVRLVNDAPHAGVIELGARPFWPPLAPLIEWVRRKAAALGIVQLRPGKTFRGQASLTSDQGAEAVRVARAIQAAIARRGLPPHYIMRNQLSFAVQALDRAFVRHLRRIARGGGEGGAE